jgi:N-acetylglutamate synthase-like GNAT family acetyltransferase
MTMDLSAGHMIRDARAADAPRLTEIVHSSRAYDGAYHTVITSLTIDAAYVAANPTRVCVDGESEIVGFASLLLPGRGVAGEAELDYMFVADGQQGRGIGRTLIADVVGVATGLGVERIHIVSHPPSEGFYRSVGAERVGEIPPAGRVTWSRPHLRLDIARNDIERNGTAR